MSEPLKNILRLVDHDKPTMGYLYEAMDRAKEAIRSYYVGKGTPGFHRQMMIWELIDSQWTGILHRPIHLATLFLNLAFSYKCDFGFDGEVMEGLLTCLHRMVPDYETRNAINREIQAYQGASGLFGFDDAIREMTTFRPRKSLECFI